MKGIRMKNVVLLTVAFATLGFANARLVENEPCKRLEKMETYLKDSVKITAEQTAKIKTAHATACTKFKAIKASQQSEEEKKAAMRDAQKSLKAEYKTILTNEQQAKLKAKGKNMHNAKMAGEKKNKPGKPKNPAKHAEERSQKMKVKYGLSDEQTARVKTAIETMLTKKEALKADSTVSKSDKAAKMKEVRDTFITSMQSILTAEQFAKWKVDSEEMREKGKEKRNKSK